MKKLAIFLIVLISLVVIAGCNTSKKTVTRFSTDEETSDNGTTTTITKVDETEKTEPAKIEIPAKDESDSAVKIDTPKTGEDVAFAVTSPAEKVTDSDKGYHLIQGTTPKDTDKILVNGTAVTKYKAGSTKWNYIAAASLGTLKKGRNYYVVKALDDKGNELGSKSFTINYEGLQDGKLVNTGNESILLSLVIAFFGYIALAYLKSFTFSKIQK